MDAKLNFHSLLKLVIRENLLKRLFIILITLLCCGLSLFLSWERFGYYMKEPTTISYGLEVMKVIHLPSLTVCPVHGFKGRLVEQEKAKRNVSSVYELLNAGLNLNDIWTLTGGDFTKSVFRIHYSFKVDFNLDNWKLRYTVLGLCYTYDFPDPIMFAKGDLMYIVLNYYTTNTYNIFVHDITADVSYLDIGRGFLLKPLVATVLTQQRRIISHENTTQRPCYTLEAYKICLHQCHDKEILLGKSCRLPFITPEASNLSLCSTPEDFQNAFPILNANTKSTLFGILKECKKKCGRPCVKNQYEVMKGEFMFPKNCTAVVLSTLGRNLKVVEESLLYPVNALFSDVGSVVGLYTGYSLLTAFEFIEFIFFSLFFRQG